MENDQNATVERGSFAAVHLLENGRTWRDDAPRRAGPHRIDVGHATAQIFKSRGSQLLMVLLRYASCAKTAGSPMRSNFVRYPG